MLDILALLATILLYALGWLMIRKIERLGDKPAAEQRAKLGIPTTRNLMRSKHGRYLVRHQHHHRNPHD